jgi:hypothetical protein
MTIIGLHIPHDGPLAPAQVDERDARSYYPYVQGGPIEAGYVTIEGVPFAIYVNSRYLALDDSMVNEGASRLFELGQVPMAGGAVRGDALVVLQPDDEYDRSLPPELLGALLAAGGDR